MGVDHTCPISAPVFDSNFKATTYFVCGTVAQPEVKHITVAKGMGWYPPTVECRTAKPISLVPSSPAQVARLSLFQDTDNKLQLSRTTQLYNKRLPQGTTVGGGNSTIVELNEADLHRPLDPNTKMLTGNWINSVVTDAGQVHRISDPNFLAQPQRRWIRSGRSGGFSEQVLALSMELRP